MLLAALLFSMQVFASSNFSHINSLSEPLIPNAQAITADASGAISVKMIMQRNTCDSDPCAGSISVQLYSNSSGHPGVALGSPVVRALADMRDFYELDPFSTTPPVEEFDLAVPVSQGVKYYVVITLNGAFISDNDAIDVGFDDYSLDNPAPSDEPFQYFYSNVWQSSSGELLTDVTIQ